MPLGIAEPIDLTLKPLRAGASLWRVALAFSFFRLSWRVI
jgi:hypothetical protein